MLRVVVGTGLTLGIAFNGVISPSHPAAPGTRVWTYAEGMSIGESWGEGGSMPTAKVWPSAYTTEV